MAASARPCIAHVRLGGAVLCALLGLSVTPSGASNTEATRATLRGLLGVQVVMGAFTPEVESAGLLRQPLHTEVELRLRLAGIRVLTPEERLRVVGHPVLAVNVHVLLNQLLGLTVYHISVALYQAVSLDTGVVASEGGATWYIATMGTLATSDLSRVREHVRDLIDAFSDAYLSVNPRPTGGPVLAPAPRPARRAR